MPFPRTVWDWFVTLIAVAFGMLAGIVIGATVTTLAERGPPVEILAEMDAGDIAAHDGMIFVYYSSVRTQMCAMKTVNWLFTEVDRDGQKLRVNVPLGGDVSVPAVHTGASKFIFSVPLPAGLWQADWYFQTESLDYCGPIGWLFPTRRVSEPVRIDVERARAVADMPVVNTQTGKVLGQSPVAVQ